MRPVAVLVGAYRHTSVAKALAVAVRPDVENAEYVRDLSIFQNLGHANARHVQRDPAQREHAMLVAPDGAQAGDNEGFGAVPLREDERARVGIAPAVQRRVVLLDHYLSSLGHHRLLQRRVQLLFGLCADDGIEHAQLRQFGQHPRRDVYLEAQFAHCRGQHRLRLRAEGRVHDASDAHHAEGLAHGLRAYRHPSLPSHGFRDGTQEPVAHVRGERAAVATHSVYEAVEVQALLAEAEGQHAACFGVCSPEFFHADCFGSAQDLQERGGFPIHLSTLKAHRHPWSRAHAGLDAAHIEKLPQKRKRLRLIYPEARVVGHEAHPHEPALRAFLPDFGFLRCAQVVAEPLKEPLPRVAHFQLEEGAPHVSAADTDTVAASRQPRLVVLEVGAGVELREDHARDETGRVPEEFDGYAGPVVLHGYGSIVLV